MNVPKLNLQEEKVETKEEQGKVKPSKITHIKASSRQVEKSRPTSFRRPKTPRDLIREAAVKSKKSKTLSGNKSNNSIPIRPQVAKRQRLGRSRPKSSGRQLSQTVGMPMQLSRKTKMDWSIW